MGSGVSYREITVKSALTRVQGMPFAWSLNPYSGCERACVYCYARDYHARRGRDTGAGFDREIDVKVNFPDLLAHELRRLRKRETVAVGTATVLIGRVYRFDQIVEAHTDMEQNRAGGKLVVTT